MKAGDIVKAVWEDGLVLIGKYLKFEKGYVILIDGVSKNIVCNYGCVRLEVINEN